MSLRPVLEREGDGRQINDSGLLYGVLKGQLVIEPADEDGVALINGERWGRVD